MHAIGCLLQEELAGPGGRALCGRAMRCACLLGGLAKGAEEPRKSLASLARGTPQRLARRFARLANLPIEVSRTRGNRPIR
jgi:hypothetical protein